MDDETLMSGVTSYTTMMEITSFLIPILRIEGRHTTGYIYGDN